MPTHSILTAERMKKIANNKRQAGFSTLELLIVIAMSVIITAIAVPSYLNTAAYLRAAGDLRSLNGVTAQAKMRAAADFTHARVYANLTGNAYQLQVWDKAANSGKGCWVEDTDPKLDANKTCLTFSGGAPSGTVFNLSQGLTFGFGSLTTGPTQGQTTIGQAAACLDEKGGGVGGTTACIVFNSRGIPIDSTLAPVPSGALYLTNGTVVNGVTVSATGSIQAWSSPASSANWSGQ
jgi:Tfp pilus assembly protein FimT